MSKKKKIEKNKNAAVRSINNNIRSSVRKLNPILRGIVGKKVEVAIRDLEFSEKINTIGWTWKSFTNGSFTTDSNKVFYVKDEYDTVYRLYFTAFAGSSSGDLSYSVEDVTALLSSEGYQQEATFGIYTDASLNKTVNIIYNTNGDLQENSIAIYATSGRCVYKSKLENNGFHNKPINLSSLANGVYLCQFKSGNTITTKKFVLN